MFLRWEPAQATEGASSVRCSSGHTAFGNGRDAAGSASGLGASPAADDMSEEAYTDEEDAVASAALPAGVLGASELTDGTLLWHGALDAALPSRLLGGAHDGAHEHAVRVAFAEAGDYRLTLTVLAATGDGSSPTHIVTETVLDHQERR